MTRKRLFSNRKAVSLSVGALLLFAVAANSQAGWVFILGAAIFGVVVAGGVLPGLGIRRIDVVRNLPRAARVGDQVEVEIDLVNQGRGRSALVEGTDSLFAGTKFLIEEIAPRATVRIAYRTSPVRRGRYEGAPVILSSGAPFGMRQARRRIDVDSPVVVHPHWVNIPSFPLLESASTPQELVHERRRGAGMDFYGIREYRSGDSLRHVHWRSTARTGRLYVREFEEYLASRLGVLIDSAETLGTGPGTTFECAVSCAASLVVYALEAGHPAQIFCDARTGKMHLFEPGRLEALDWLAEIEAGGRRGLARLVSDAAGEIQRRSTNVLVFATTRRNYEEARVAASVLQDLATRVIAVMVSASSYAPEDPRAMSPRDEESLAEELAATRVTVYRVAKGQDLGTCLREPSLV